MDTSTSTDAGTDAGTTAVQLALVTDEPHPTPQFLDISLSMLPENSELHTDPPDAAFVQSVRDHGVLQPILVMEKSVTARKHRYEFVFGQKRVWASRLAGYDTVRALVYPIGWRRREVLALVENNKRKPNPISDLEAIEHLRAQHYTDDDIKAATGMDAQVFASRLRLSRLIAPLRAAMLSNQMQSSVGERCSRLALPYQQKIALDFEARCKTHGAKARIKQKDVLAALHIQRVEALDQIPDDAFDTPDVTTTSSTPTAEANFEQENFEQTENQAEKQAALLEPQVSASPLSTPTPTSTPATWLEAFKSHMERAFEVLPVGTPRAFTARMLAIVMDAEKLEVTLLAKEQSATRTSERRRKQSARVQSEHAEHVEVDADVDADVEASA